MMTKHGAGYMYVKGCFWRTGKARCRTMSLKGLTTVTENICRYAHAY